MHGAGRAWPPSHPHLERAREASLARTLRGYFLGGGMLIKVREVSQRGCAALLQLCVDAPRGLLGWAAAAAARLSLHISLLLLRLRTRELQPGGGYLNPGGPSGTRNASN